MRCYLMKAGHIHAVVMLDKGPDAQLVEQAEGQRTMYAHEGVDGVEVWSGVRFIYRTPDPPNSN